MMRHYLHINLNDKTVATEEMHGEALAKAGRYFIAKTLVESGVAKADPLSPDNPLIFSAGPFAGTNFSNANRTSVGCKSPLTGGIKEANAGGSFALALGQANIGGFTLHNAAPDWIVIYIDKNGKVTFDPAAPYLGKGNFEAAALLHEKYGNKVSLALCGPVGEYRGLLAGIAFSDTDRRPSRLAARGGVGAVMGNKKVKAIVVETSRMPALHDRKKVIGAVREYADKLSANEIIQSFRDVGTAAMADFTNHTGGLPVRNFSAGRLVDTGKENFRMGGAYIRELTLERGGEPSHACMPGCVIQCSNVYVGKDGKEIVSPVEYETIGLMGTNCGLSDPDELARVNYIANDLGVDSIETGATVGVLMEAGVGKFGDVGFIVKVLEEIRNGTDNGKLWAQGTARVGRHYNVARVPVIKQQAISAYDPRVVEITGISMMVTAQGADHTTGNVPYMASIDKDIDELVDASMQTQIDCAAYDSLGLCLFGRSVTKPNLAMITEAVNNAIGSEFSPDFFEKIGKETLKLESQFNREAGFKVDDDELPAFFYNEKLPPTNQTARFHAAEVRQAISNWWQQQG